MILTNCAACAAPLERLAKQCSRCKTRYCNEACQRQHSARGLPPDWTEEDLRRQGHDLDARVEQGHYDSNGHYRPGEDEEAVTPRAAWTAAQTL